MSQQQWPAWWDPSQTRNIGPYPGAGNAGYPVETYGYVPQEFGQQLPAVSQPSGGGSGLLGNFNLKDIKTVIDRMGGIDGIISTVGKVQKIVGSIQQMQPIIKMLLSLMPGKSKVNADTDEVEEEWSKPRRRRRRRIRRSSARRGRGRGRVKSRKKAYSRSTLYTPYPRRRGPYRY